MFKSDRYGEVPLGAEAIPGVQCIELARGKLVRLIHAAGSTIIARAGAIWITEEDGRRDVVLRAGQSFTLRRRGLALVEAFSDASISLS